MAFYTQCYKAFNRPSSLSSCITVTGISGDNDYRSSHTVGTRYTRNERIEMNGIE